MLDTLREVSVYVMIMSGILSFSLISPPSPSGWPFADIFENVDVQNAKQNYVQVRWRTIKNEVNGKCGSLFIGRI